MMIGTYKYEQFHQHAFGYFYETQGQSAMFVHHSFMVKYGGWVLVMMDCILD